MSWAPFEIIWDWPALHAFFRLAPHTAYIVDRAVIRFAERGEGDIRHEAPYHHLRAGLHNAVLAVDENAGTLCVVRIYRHRL
jgi:hypothetical protein